MPVVITCPSCSKQLRLREQVEGKRLRCPECGSIFAFAQAPPEVEPEERLTQRPAAAARRSRPAEADAEAPAAPRKRRRSEDIQTEPVARRAPADEEPLELPVDDDEGPRRRAKPGKKKRKGRRLPPPAADDREPLVWPWWAFGGSGVLLALAACLYIAVFSSSLVAKGNAAYMLVMTPISAVIFFVAMLLSNVMLGGAEIGDLRVVPVKVLILILLANAVSLVPFIGGFFALIIWVAGTILLLHADLWEARMIILINWVLNWGVKYLLFTAIFSWATHGGGIRHDIEMPPPDAAGQPDHVAPWGAGDVQEHGGTVQFDPARPNDEVVIGISLRGTRVTDLDLAHMQDFPELQQLDLTSVPITDLGLAMLQPCKNLRQLKLKGTKVTDEGVRELQRRLPQLKIER
jgi:hypothetical protein